MIKTTLYAIAVFPLVLLVEILAFVIVPIAAIFADSQGRLPRWARIYETHDALGFIGPLTEPVTTATYRIHPKLGLIHYLLRNKAYTFRTLFRATPSPDSPLRIYGDIIPPQRYGFSYAIVIKDSYWELQPRILLKSFYVYARIGWKMMPYINASTHPTAGLYIGISIRSDDWDDFK